MRSIRRAWERVLRHRSFINGPEVDALESRLARWLGWRYAVGCNSGFGAHLLTLLAMGIAADSVVAVPAFGPYPFAGALLRRRARPAFVEVNEATLNFDIDAFQQTPKLSYAAVVLHDLFGGTAPISDVAKHLPRIPVVEVMTYAFGAIQGTPRGGRAFVATACLRDPNTMAAYGDAGMIWTDDATVAERVRYIRSELNESGTHEGIESGNFHQDTVHAAILLELWNDRLDRLRRRSQQIQEYAAAIERLGIPDVRVPRLYSMRATHLVILVKRRELLMEHLRQAGIESRAWWPTPLHLQRGFRELGYSEGAFPVAERVARDNMEIVFNNSAASLKRTLKALSAFYSH